MLKTASSNFPAMLTIAHKRKHLYTFCFHLCTGVFYYAAAIDKNTQPVSISPLSFSSKTGTAAEFSHFFRPKILGVALVENRVFEAVQTEIGSAFTPFTSAWITPS